MYKKTFHLIPLLILSFTYATEVKSMSFELFSKHQNETKHSAEQMDADEYKADCTLFSSSTPKAIGNLVLTQKGKDVTIVGSIRMLKANSKMGMHFHEYGNFSDKTNMCDSVGGHFNPFGKFHGCPKDSESHIGDLGNISSKADGTVEISITTNRVSLKLGVKKSVIGRSLVVHIGTDDCGKGDDDKSKINGNSGKRFACCIIGIAKIFYSFEGRNSLTK